MKICLYSPYIPQHFGGGEKYMFDVALACAQKHQVSVAVDPQYSDLESVADSYRKFMDKPLKNISFVHTPLRTKASIITKLAWTAQFDRMYYLTDGSLFFSLARRNILHIQFPLRLDKRSPIERLKLANWQVKNTNSEFTKKIVSTSWPVKITRVHHPMVDVTAIKTATEDVKKQKVILHVGRFFTHLHAKRQDVIVDMWRELRKKHAAVTKGWKLVLVGSVEDTAYAKKVARQARDLPVEIYHNLSRPELLKWYGRAQIYWHATGFGVNQDKYPEKVEHFGISTVEAMAAGAVPVVINKGGQPEVVGEDFAELLWDTKSQAVTTTAQLLADTEARRDWGEKAQQRANQFSPQQFTQELEQMMGAKL